MKSSLNEGYTMPTKPKLITKEEFKAAVELWEHKGHTNVVEVNFNSNTINLFVSDYVNPDIRYFINVIDTDSLDC